MAEKAKTRAQGPRRFAIPADEDLDALLGLVAKRLTVRREAACDSTRRYYDTFGWLLFAAGYALYEEVENGRRRLHLESMTGTARSYTLRIKNVPRFADDLPAGSLRSTITDIAPLRALLPRVELAFRRRRLRVLNDDGKTVVRLIADDEARALAPEKGVSTAMGAILSVVPVRGYVGPFRELCRYLEDDRGLPAHPRHPLVDVLHALAVTPEAYSSRPDTPVDPTLRADEAVRLILLDLLDVVEINESGLRANLDTEFLHDFRVAVRRTRSVLSQLRGVFDPATLARFRPEFKWLGGITGATRDLDVYLLRFPDYLSWLPEVVQADLTPLHTFLEHRQRREHALLVEQLDLPRYRSLLGEWRAYLKEPAPQPAPNPMAARAVLDVASERIWKSYRRVLRDGNAILRDSDARSSDLHRLRIACKKLRYLMEVFARLYEPARIKKPIRALKRLQDNLGDFQDFEVQQKKLQGFALQMMKEQDVDAETMLAMGRLEARLAVLQQRAQAAFADEFRKFARARHRRQFTELFHSRG